MLDDLKYIHEKDVQDALGIAEKQAEQYLYDYGFDWKAPQWITNLIVAGMGGSALAAKTFKTYPGVPVPFEIVQDYELPPMFTSKTLLICSSYSGNTEETVSVLEQALATSPDNRPMLVVVASGGKLQEIAEQNDIPFVKLPSGYQPRHTFGFQYRALAEICASTGLQSKFVSELESAIPNLQTQIMQWTPVVPTATNPAKQIALELLGKSTVIYAGPKLATAAYKWKISFNENAKAVAWYNTYPEFNHNEFLGWTKQPEHKPYTIIDLRSNLEHPQVQKRFELSARLLSGLRPEPIVVSAHGKTLLDQLLSVIALGDFVSLYQALLAGLNPTPVDLIEKFKQELA